MKIGILLVEMVSASFQYTSSSCKLSSAKHYVCKYQNREHFYIVQWDDLWEEEDSIDFDSDITCVIFEKMQQTRFSKKNDDASEGASELTSKDGYFELSSDDRGESYIVEPEVTEDDDLVDDEHEAIIESPSSKKRRD